MLEEFFRDEKLLQTFAKHYETGEPLPAEIIRKMNTAGAFGRADWVRTQLFYTTLSLDLHDQDPSARLTSMRLRSGSISVPGRDVDRWQPHVREL